MGVAMAMRYLSFLIGLGQMDVKRIDCLWGGGEGSVKVGSKVDESGLYLSKRGDRMTSCFVGTNTNLISSNSLTHAEGEMESI